MIAAIFLLIANGAALLAVAVEGSPRRHWAVTALTAASGAAQIVLVAVTTMEWLR